MTNAIVYAAKSTEDTRGSIPTQLSDGKALATREGLDVVGEYHDEAASAFHGSRGPGLKRALAECERLAAEHGECALIVQHSDRLARGSGRKGEGKHLLHYALWAVEHDVTILSVQDPQTFGDLLYVAVTGQRNHEDSERKSKSVKDGLRRRKDSGRAFGRLPFGYTHRPKLDAAGQPIVLGSRLETERVADPETMPIVHRMYDMADAGHTPGDIARQLGKEGIRTRLGAGWNSRRVREVLENVAYTGQKGYPRVIAPERQQRIVAGLKRLDPAAVQARKGGRPGTAEYVLRGVGFCACCGEPLYARKYANGRHYVCRAVLQAHGTCDARRIPAEQAEGHAVRHLSAFVGDVEGWLAEVAGERQEQHQRLLRVVEGERERLAELTREREQISAQYRKLMAGGKATLAEVALEEAARVDGEVTAQQAALSDAEAAAGEFAVPTDIDSALDVYNELVALVRGKVASARGAAELNAALREVLAGVYLATDGEQLRGEFQLREGLAPEPAAVPEAEGYCDLGAGVQARYDTALALGKLLAAEAEGQEEATVQTLRKSVV